MKNTRILAVAVAVSLASAAAYAQVRQPAPAGANPRIRLDANQDGVIDRTEAAKAPKLAARFDQLDLDKDGKLSAGERPRMGAAHRRGGGAGREGRMMKLDVDKDGRISRVEAQAGAAKWAERFERMDVNKDGYLDRADMQAKAAQMKAAFFQGADANRDGRVTRDEFIVEQGARRAQRREQWAGRGKATDQPMAARKAPTEQQQIERAGKAFAQMDANRDGALTRAEFEAFKPAGRGKGHRMGDAPVPATP